MKKYKPKTDIGEYTNNNELNARIYQVLLNFQNSKTHCRNKLNPLKIFNKVYAICEQLEQEQHPEQTISKIWHKLRRERFLLCETNVIFSCVYVVLLFSKKENPNMQFFLNSCRQRIDEDYFQEFEHLIREELTQITPLTDDFEELKKEADKITDLNQRELFYIEFLTHRHQSENKGNIVKQVIEEISLIQRTKELTTIEKDTLNSASMKIKAVVILELLKGLQLGPANNDLSKISRLITYLTDFSYNSVYRALQGGICFTDFHNEQIAEVNKILTELNATISININKQY